MTMVMLRLIWLPLLCLAGLGLTAGANGNKSALQRQGFRRVRSVPYSMPWTAKAFPLKQPCRRTNPPPPTRLCQPRRRPQCLIQPIRQRLLQCLTRPIRQRLRQCSDPTNSPTPPPVPDPTDSPTPAPVSDPTNSPTPPQCLTRPCANAFPSV
jgi:hypothetical protein